MATSRKSNGPVMPIRSSFHRAGQLSSSSSSSFASSTSLYSSSSTSGFFSQKRATSPTRVNLHGLSPSGPTPSVRFSIDRSISPRRSISTATHGQAVQRNNGNIQKRTCMCSPTNHPGSFRCALHKKNRGAGNSGGNNQSVAYSPNGLNMRRSAMTNSLVRIGTVEGDLMKRALASLIRPSSHQQRRRAGFQIRPSRLSIMSKADERN